MIRAAPLFEGEQDFRSMATNNGAELLSTVRTLYSSRLERAGPRLIYRVRGSGFLYNRVRNIVGTLLEVGRGNISADSIPAILEARDRSAAGPTAPAVGLFLVSVEYPDQG
jgi:tRNA pseudouridine38-40 synthase